MFKSFFTLLRQVYANVSSFVRNFIASIGELVREAFDDSALNSKNTDAHQKSNDDHYFLPPMW